MLRFCMKSLALIVALVATFVGLLTSGFISQYTPLFVFLDKYQANRGQFFKGMFPATHRDEPWGFTAKEVEKLDLTGQNVLITGGNVGLGYWSAYHIAKTNANVVIGCRSMSKCKDAAERLKKETGKATIVPMEIDLSSFASIRKFAQEFKGKYSSLDSLMLNAGVMMPPFSLTLDGLETSIGVNHFGHFLLTQELLPLLETAAREHKVATVCVVSSAAHYDSYPEGILGSIEEMNDEKRYQRQQAYGQSKLANVLYAQELSERLRNKNILVNSIHPGAVETELGRHIVEAVSRLVGERFANGVSEMLQAASWKPKDAALTQVFASVSPKLKEQKITGKYFHPIARENIPDPHARNITLQKMLWKISEDFIAAH